MFNRPQHTGGETLLYSVNPPLPPSLTMDARSGIIMGTPTVLQLSPLMYTVTASNSGGNATCDLTIRVIHQVPEGLTYAQRNASYQIGSPIVNVPSNSGGEVS